MQNKINNKWQWLIFLLIGILFPLRMAIAEGGIATDGTVGPAQTLPNTAEVIIRQDLGTTVGKNLFHSFEQFNVNTGQTVTFTENTPNALDNVVSRVTGGSQSDINGTLSSTPKGHANLYLINPSGVMFGQNARIDVPGAFHASTADEVRFQDGARFSASQPSGSTLTAAAPASFGFLGTSSATNGLLQVDGAQLAVGQGKKLDMVGRNISVENGAKLTAPEGEVRLEAVGQGSMNIPLNQPSKTAHGELVLTKSTIDASGEGGGKVIVRGSDLNMDQSAKVLAKTNGRKDGVGIDVRLTGNLNMKGGSLIRAGTSGNGASGKILVTAKNLRIDGQNTVTGISSEAGNSAAKERHSTGRAGDIELRIENQLLLTRSGQINSSSFGTGDAGNITVNTGQLLIDTQGVPKDNSVNPLSTGIITQAAKAWSGQSGDIAVSVRGNITIKGGSRIDADSFGKHDAGELHVTAKNLLIDGQTTLNGQKSYLPTFMDSNVGSGDKDMRDEETGNAGNIILDIKDQLSLLRGGQIRSSAFGMGNAGKIAVNADQLLIDGQGTNLLKDNFGNPLLTGIFTEGKEAWSGKGGDIAVAVRGNMNMKGGSTIDASTAGTQNAGNIHIIAKNLLLDGQTTLYGQKTYLPARIASNTLGKTPDEKAGNGGNITLDIADQLSLIRGGLIISVATGLGNAGNITVKAGQLLIDGQGAFNNSVNPLLTGIVTHTRGTLNGKGGDIAAAIRGDINMKDDGIISARTFGSGKGGDITVEAQGNMAMKGGSAIDASASGTQNAGNIHITAKNLLLDGQTTLDGQKTYLPTRIASTTNYSAKAPGEKAGNGGTIMLDIVDQLSLVGGGKIHSTSFGSGDAGEVTINAGQFLLDGQGITTDNSGETLLTGIINQAVNAQSGKGGDISVAVRGDITMKGGSRIDASTSGAQNAGNIHITANNLLLDGQTTLDGQRRYALTDIASNTHYSTKTPHEKAGRAGNIILDIKDHLSLIRGGRILSTAFGSGDAGNVMVKAGQFLLDGQGVLQDNKGGAIQTGIFTGAPKVWSGKGGDISVAVRGDINMKGGGSINASTSGAQNAGDIHVIAKTLLLDGQTTLDGQRRHAPTEIASNTHYLAKTPHEKAGRAGNIILDIKDHLSLIRDGLIISTTLGSGDAGNVMVKAGQFLIDGQGALNPILTGIITSAFDARSGKGGDITVKAQGDMAMKGGSTIDASTAGTQNAGNIHITAKNLLLDGQTTLDGQKTYLPTRIASTTDSLGKTFSEKAGNGGTITLDIADQLSLIGGGKIQSSSFSSGDAGEVTINAGQFLLDGQGITTDNSGETLLTGIINQAVNAQSGKGGDISVAVRDEIAMKGGSRIDARSFGTGNAGNITVSADKLSLEQNSLISTESISGNGGNITIQRGRLVQLINSGFKTSVSGQQGGDGGNISVNGEILVMETGLVQANTKAHGASGGKIDLKVSELIPSGGRESLILGGDEAIEWKPYEFGFNVIQAAAPNGVSGLVQSTAPQLDLSGVLSNLGMPQFDTRAISQDYCSLGTGSSLIRQGKGGLPPRSRDSVLY